MPKKTGPAHYRNKNKYDARDRVVSTDVPGTVLSHDPDRQFGFVDIGTDKDLFIDFRDVRKSCLKDLANGQAVSVDVVERPRKGKETRLCAVNIRMRR